MGESFKAISVKSRREFDWYIDHLSHETLRARDHWNFWKAFEKSLKQYSVEVNQTPAFWELTRQAHRDAVILRLGRLYDPHPQAITLGTLLQTIQKHSRAPGPHLPASLAQVDGSQLDKELTRVSRSDPAVKKLLTVRNEYLAHRSSQHVARGTFAHLPTLQQKEIAKLVNRAIGILRKYRQHLGFPTLAWGNQDETDFKTLLALLRAGLKVK